MRAAPRTTPCRALKLIACAALLAALCALVVLGHLGGEVRGGLLSLCPPLLLATVLLARRYPGERVIERWREARRTLRRQRATDAPRPRPRLVSSRRGGRLIAASLAGRAPPLAAGC